MAGKIVVGIDGSEISARALEMAAEQAELFGTDLDILYALELPTDIDYYGVRYVGPQLDVMQEYATELLASAASRVAERHPDLVCTTRTEVGNPTWVLVRESEDAAAVVVGRRGLGAVKGAFLGSVSIRLATEAKCPVFIIGEGDERPSTGPVLVGVDDSDFGTAALAFALAEAARRKTGVRAVSAYRIPALSIPVEPDLIDALQKSEAAEAAKVIAEAVQQARTPETESVEVEQLTVDDAPANAILHQSKDAQLIVVGSHGRGFVRRLLLGSVSRQVLHDADRPVVVVGTRDV